MIVRAARAGEYDTVLDLVQRTFPPGDEAVMITAATLQSDPRFRPEHLRVVERDGQPIGMVNIIDRMVHVGAALVRCAIIAPLATAREHQGTGVGSALMRDALDWARANGFLLSMLWGHPWLYPRYGYAPGIKHYTVTLDAATSPIGDAAYSLRPYTSADASALQRVYQTETSTQTLAEVRSDEPWEWRASNPVTVVEVAVDPARMIRGYFRATPRDGRLHVGELFAMDTGAAHALFDRVIHVARQHEAKTIHVTATPENRWTRVAFARGGQIQMGSGGGAGMVRVLDLPGLLHEIKPELERRIAQSEFSCKRADIRIESPVGRATIVVDQGRVDVGDVRSTSSLTLPFHALGPLVVGYQRVHELIGLPGVFLHGAGRQRLLDVLFPEGYPHWPFAAYFS